jgi:hypothetical protein
MGWSKADDKHESRERKVYLHQNSDATAFRGIYQSKRTKSPRVDGNVYKIGFKNQYFLHLNNRMDTFLQRIRVQ